MHLREIEDEDNVENIVFDTWDAVVDWSDQLWNRWTILSDLVMGTKRKTCRKDRGAPSLVSTRISALMR